MSFILSIYFHYYGALVVIEYLCVLIQVCSMSLLNSQIYIAKKTLILKVLELILHIQITYINIILLLFVHKKPFNIIRYIILFFKIASLLNMLVLLIQLVNIILFVFISINFNRIKVRYFCSKHIWLFINYICLERTKNQNTLNNTR